jgi:DNA-binding NarL/FixJ family response regulator
MEKKKPHVDRVVAMTLRTAQNDIDRAVGAGIGVFLYKPFGRKDAERSMDSVVSQQKQLSYSFYQFYIQSF